MDSSLEQLIKILFLRVIITECQKMKVLCNFFVLFLLSIFYFTKADAQYSNLSVYYGKQFHTDFSESMSRKNDLGLELIKKTTHKFQYGAFLNYGWYTGKIISDTFYSFSHYSYFHFGLNQGWRFKICNHLSISEGIVEGFVKKEKNQYSANIFDPSYSGNTWFIGFDSEMNYQLNRRIELSLHWKDFFYPLHYFPPNPTPAIYTGIVDCFDISLSYKIFKLKLFPPLE